MDVFRAMNLSRCNPDDMSGSGDYNAKQFHQAAQVLAREVERLLDVIDKIDRTLRCDAAEYVPAIRDVFHLIDGSRA